MIGNAKGFTLIEVIVASVILGVGLWGTMSVVSFANRSESLKTTSTQKDAVVYNLLQDLRKRPEVLQKNYTPNLDPMPLLTTPTNFPLAWDTNQNLTDTTSCPTCKGRVGYVIQPVNNFSDFYLATVKICSNYNLGNSTCEIYQMYLVTR